MAKQYASGYNTFVKSHEATGNLVVDFSRNPESFPINQYIQLKPVDKKSGYYIEFSVEECGRVFADADLSDFVWQDGADRPDGVDGTEAFEFKEYKTIRRNYGYRLGDEAIDQAGWDIVGQHQRIKAQQAMTARSTLVAAVVGATGSYDSTHRYDCSQNTLGNTGDWAQSTSERQDIKRFLEHAAKTIHEDTLGGLDVFKDLRLVMNPTTAAAIARSQEIIDFIKQQHETVGIIQSNIPGSKWFLPKKLYGFDIVIDDAVKVSSKKDVSFSPTRGFTFPDDTIALISRPGGLEAPASGPNFSTVTLFSYKDMEVWQKHDEENELVKGSVVDDFDVVMTAPAAGFLFTNAV